MLNKPKDVPYCGVDEQKIKQAQPILHEVNFKRLYDWINGRYMVRKRKDVLMLPPPWTKNPVLRDYRFTNVKREHDRETKWLLERITNNPKLSYENKLVNTMLFRMYNKKETMEILYSTNGGQPLDFTSIKGIDLDKIRKALEDTKDYTYFTAVFLTCGLKVALGNQVATNDEYMPMRPIKFAIHLAETGVVDKIKASKDQKEVFKAITSYNGLGTFLGYQIFVDFSYIPEFPFSENEFTVSGPGCDRGLKLIFENFDGMNMEEALFWLRDNIDREFIERGYNWRPAGLFSDLDKWDQTMNVMSLENCMCEISKYIRALDGTGRPRNRYKGGQ